MHSAEIIEDMRRLIEAGSMQIKRQGDYVLGLQRAGTFCRRYSTTIYCSLCRRLSHSEGFGFSKC